MKNVFYLDDYNLICSNIHERFLNGNLKLLKNNNEIEFSIRTDNNDVSLEFNETYKEGDTYAVVHENDKYEVLPRFISHSKKFDENYCPDVNTLGSFYRKNCTVFRLWSPFSEAAYVVVDGEPYRMAYLDKGLYEAQIKGNLKNAKYHYEVIRDQERFCFKDIFAYSNTKDNKESYVIDLKDIKNNKVKVKENDDPIIYELSVRDFSSDINAPFINKGKFLAFLEEGLKVDNEPIGIDYLEKLGVSHIQLMPINNFDLDGGEYSWGYNPLDYNSLYWGYVVGDEPLSPINEFRSLVNKLHEKGLHVNLDVVFNHVYKIDTSTFNLMFPYYFFRYKENGMPADGTYCGSEVRSEAKFVKEYFKLLIDRYIKLYDIDGLRFDLAGIIDTSTMSELIELANERKKDFMMYGEGWNMGDVLPSNQRTTIENANSITSFAFFNGWYRDILKGSIFEKYTKGYLLGNKTYENAVKDGLKGSYNLGLNDKQTINYIECHDNNTFYDKVSFFNYDEETRKNICKSGLASIFVSYGIPFIHAGQEFLRTKKGNDNSYNLDDEINKIDWLLMVKNKDVVDYFKKLIDFRKKYKVFNPQFEPIFSYYYDLLIYSVDNIDVFINPSEYPYIYNNWITYKEILFADGKIANNLKVFDIPAFSIIVGVRV